MNKKRKLKKKLLILDGPGIITKIVVERAGDPATYETILVNKEYIGSLIIYDEVEVEVEG